MNDARRPYAGTSERGAWTALRTPLCGRGERVEVPVAEAKKLAQAAQDWILGGNVYGAGAARAAAVDIAIHDADGLLDLIRAGRLPRTVVFLSSVKGKPPAERSYNPMGRQATFKQARRPWGVLVGGKGQRSTVSSDQASRLELLLDPDGEVTMPDGQTFLVGPLHEDIATPEERSEAEAKAEAKRIRISEWVEAKQAVERGEAPPPKTRQDRPSRPQEATAGSGAAPGVPRGDRELVEAARAKALAVLEMCEKYLHEWDGAVPF